ncbi:MAG: hypothetical protein LBF37_00095 [Rickettsiales bacterium]|jgi:hypothetical protein|nr:hypothetical protein [Rickettsiales bacterium]
MTGTAKFELQSNKSESNDLKYIKCKNIAERDLILQQKNERILKIPDSDFYEIQTVAAKNILQLEKYYKYHGTSSLPADLDIDWKKFLLLWEKTVYFTKRDCKTFASKMEEATVVMQALTGHETKLSKHCEALTNLFQRAVADGRQVIYSSR